MKNSSLQLRAESIKSNLIRSDRSNHATPEQREWMAALREAGYMCVVAYGAEEAIRAITHYLSLEGGYE